MAVWLQISELHKGQGTSCFVTTKRIYATNNSADQTRKTGQVVGMRQEAEVVLWEAGCLSLASGQGGCDVKSGQHECKRRVDRKQ